MNSLNVQNILLVFLIYFLASCGNKQNQFIASQNEYLNKRIIDVSTKLDREVEATNFLLQGVRLVHKKEKLRNKYDSISNLLITNELEIAKIKTNELILLLDDQSEMKIILQEVLKNLNSSNKYVLNNNLAFSVIETIQSYRDEFDNLFYEYYEVYPVLFDETTCIKAGQKYEGEIMMVAMKLTTERIFEADYPDDGKGFVKLPVSESLGGKVIIDNLKPGQTRIKVRVTESHKNQKKTFDNEVLLEPK